MTVISPKDSKSWRLRPNNNHTYLRININIINENKDKNIDAFDAVRHRCCCKQL